MIYTMSKKPFGISRISPIFDIQFNYDISDLFYTDEFGFFFLVKGTHCIGNITLEGKLTFPWIGEIEVSGDMDGSYATFTNPSSMCYSKTQKHLFVVTNGGKQIRDIDVSSNYVSTMIKGKTIEKHNTFFKHTHDNISTSCDIDKIGNIIWSVKDIHRVFKFVRDRHEINILIGNGKSGFSVSNKLTECSIRLPSTVRCMDDLIILCDSGNNCIRGIGKEFVNVIVGDPGVLGDRDGTGHTCLLSYPYNLKCVNNIMYFIDNQKIKQFSLVDRSVKTIKSFENKVLIESNKKDLFILERS